MIVWRVEDDEGRGPFTYHSHIINDFRDETGIDPCYNPPPREDPKLKKHFTLEHHCGFESIEQFHLWFGSNPKHHKILGEAGLGLTKYETDAIVGEHQVIFVKEKARKVDRQLFIPTPEPRV